MEVIAREIEMTCLGKLKNENNNIILKILDEQVLPRELHALLNSLTLGTVGCVLYGTMQILHF